MKYIWEAEDIRPHAYYVRGMPSEGDTPKERRGKIEYAVSTLAKIGYLSISDDSEEKYTNPRKKYGEYVSIAMTDGMVMNRGKTREEFAESLNEGGYQPISGQGMCRLMTEYFRNREFNE